MTRDFTLAALDDDAATVLGIISRRLRMTQGQLYTVVLALLLAAALLLTGLPGVGGTTPNSPADLSNEVQP